MMSVKSTSEDASEGISLHLGQRKAASPRTLSRATILSPQHSPTHTGDCGLRLKIRLIIITRLGTLVLVTSNDQFLFLHIQLLSPNEPF